MREFVNQAFKNIGINIKWRGKGLNEVGYDSKTKKIYIKIDKIYFRPKEVYELRGNSSKAKKILGWKPKVSFKQMVKNMVDYDIKKFNENDKEF